jgi:hypothetical protein
MCRGRSVKMTCQNLIYFNLQGEVFFSLFFYVLSLILCSYMYKIISIHIFWQFYLFYLFYFFFNLHACIIDLTKEILSTHSQKWKSLSSKIQIVHNNWPSLIKSLWEIMEFLISLMLHWNVRISYPEEPERSNKIEINIRRWFTDFTKHKRVLRIIFLCKPDPSRM